MKFIACLFLLVVTACSSSPGVADQSITTAPVPADMDAAVPKAPPMATPAADDVAPPVPLPTTDTLLVTEGQSNTIEYGGGVTDFPAFHTGETSVWYWMEETDMTYHVSRGTGDATGSTGNAFMPAGRIIDTVTPHSPPYLYGLRALQQAGIKAQAVMVAKASTKLFDDWNPDATTGLRLFNVLEHEVEAAIASPSFTLAPNCRIVWMSYIGEADSLDPKYAAVYQQRYQRIMDLLKAHFPGHEHTFVIVKTNYTGPANATIRDAQDALAAANPRTYAIETVGLPIIQPHYKTEILGVIAARGLRKALGLRTIGVMHNASGAGYMIQAENRVLSGSTSMTDVFYVRKTTDGALTASRKYLFRCTDTGSQGYAIYLQPPKSPTGTEDAAVGLDIVDGSGTHRVLDLGNIELQRDVIHQLAFTFDGSNVRLYLDAAQIGTSQAVAGYTAQKTTANGNQMGQVTGSIAADEVGIVAFAASETNALTAAELAAARDAARASDDFTIPHQKLLLDSMWASDTTSNSLDGWFDTARSIPAGYFAPDGMAQMDYVEAAYP